MLKETLTSVWASMDGWLNSAILFLLFNLIICTVAFSSSLRSSPSQEEERREEDHFNLFRSSSVLERFRSFKLSLLEPEQPPPTSPLPLEQNPEELLTTCVSHRALDDKEEKREAHGESLQSQLDRSISDKLLAGGDQQPEKMKAASVSADELFQQKEDMGEARLQKALARGDRSVYGREPDDEVNAKADDFISRFKQQLKLERLDSIMRYKEMLMRGR